MTEMAEQTEMMEPKANPIPKVNQIVEIEVKRWHGTADSRVFGWQTMPVTEALRLQDETFRCPECLGKVRLRRSTEEGLPDYAEHYSKNPGCSLGNCFTGEKKQHPKPVSN